MAGDNQHFIPQFLQRGFASQKIGKTAYTWKFRANDAPEERKIKEVGADLHFYTEPNDTVVDDTITTAENHFGNLANRLRACPVGPVFDGEIAPFISHLEIRTRHVRESFLKSADFLIRRILSFLEDPDAVVRLVSSHIAANPDLIKNQFIEEMDKAEVPKSVQNEQLPTLLKLAEENREQLLEMQKPLFSLAVQSMKNLPSARLETAIKDGHLRALKKDIHPQIRVEALSALKFRVINVPRANMILGDSAVLFQTASVREFRPFTDKNEVIRSVFLPLTPTRVLIGEIDETEWDCEVIRSQVAQCSLEYFISHQNSPENVQLSKEIGRSANMLTSQELDEIALKTFRELEDPKSLKMN